MIHDQPQEVNSLVSIMTKNYQEISTSSGYQNAFPNETLSVIALGSNLGDSQKILNEAIFTLKETEKIQLINHSHWYQTKPVGPPQPDYLNGCAIINTTLSPHQLLNTLLEIEKKFGRERKEKWGARTLDLDLIFYGDLILNTSTLEIPHPRMRERTFVLEPLAEIAPHWIDPVTGLRVSELLINISENKTLNLEA
ncbi:2-amino-4-hydroxy-6-hydroxymethyldihydropteridin epyrophosphokinase [Cyanobacterium aponinum PCC 10605]|uniref:2-amino-4-hydroxy-6-hydroxymethyldihydropteridine diphosphokinase n=2 Tax=Cyanobacterium TaxID=102234 RepID=K9Z424_CYAAP|nr:2-amino-4-hydroxy-6-hydroxymethyldihydropteridin epyrophosphokinase [Cyanobacterium aponinum PCC 10605]